MLRRAAKNLFRPSMLVHEALQFSSVEGAFAVAFALFLRLHNATITKPREEQHTAAFCFLPKHST